MSLNFANLFFFQLLNENNVNWVKCQGILRICVFTNFLLNFFSAKRQWKNTAGKIPQITLKNSRKTGKITRRRKLVKINRFLGFIPLPATNSRLKWIWTIHSGKLFLNPDRFHRLNFSGCSFGRQRISITPRLGKAEVQLGSIYCCTGWSIKIETVKFGCL